MHRNVQVSAYCSCLGMNDRLGKNIDLLLRFGKRRFHQKQVDENVRAYVESIFAEKLSKSRLFQIIFYFFNIVNQIVS